jgi:integrase
MEMARMLHRLKAGEIDKLPIGKHHEGGGLYLHVTVSGRYWFFRWGRGGRGMQSLGPTHAVSLADARAKAAAARKLLVDGRDPKIEREAVRAAARAHAARQVTFAVAADAYVESHKAAWRTQKHCREVRETLRVYAEPIVGNLPVGAVDTTLVLRILQPLWTARPDAAARVRQRTESVLDYAKARGWRDGENPCRWRGHLDHLLPRSERLKRVEPHAALPWRELPALMTRLRAIDTVEARALEFLILNASRMQEARRARFDEIDGNVWTVPGSRMKAGRQHRVPLSDGALAVVERMRKASRSPFIFPGRGGVAIGKSSLQRLLFDLVGERATVHGMRSAFVGWAKARGLSVDLREAALAHAIRNTVRGAYEREDLLDERRPMMQGWADFAAGADKVVSLRAIVS